MTTVKAIPVHRQLFTGLQDELRASLEKARTVVTHNGTKGGLSENQWRVMLATHLPKRYAVSQGFVLDAAGNQSEQIDVIIHDAQYCPHFLNEGGTQYVPAESVYAVFDSKQAINAKELRAAAQKVASVRRLGRTSGAIVDRGVARPARELFTILGGILALSSDWSDGLGGAFREQLKLHTGDARIDFGCAIGSGAFEVPADAGDGDVTTGPSERALLGFFVALLRRLQAQGTASVIEWHKYEESL